MGLNKKHCFGPCDNILHRGEGSRSSGTSAKIKPFPFSPGCFSEHQLSGMMAPAMTVPHHSHIAMVREILLGRSHRR